MSNEQHSNYLLANARRIEIAAERREREAVELRKKAAETRQRHVEMIEQRSASKPSKRVAKRVTTD